MTDIKSFFDTHAHNHNYSRAPDFYREVAIALRNRGSPVRLLDLGCGDGSFLKTVIEYGLRGDFLGIDLSSSMLKGASDNLRPYEAGLVLADGFRLPLNEEVRFDLIHLDSVLHHLIGKTRVKSKNRVHDLLNNLSEKLSERGSLLVEEFYYGSYIIPTFTAGVVFYALKLINFLKIDLRSLSELIIPGLEVNFYCQNELYNILCKYGKVRIIKKNDNFKIPTLNKLLLQKEFGHVSFLVEKNGWNGSKTLT